MKLQRSQNAFTLIEVLVVILVIGVLIAILVPAVTLLRASFLDSSTGNILKTTQHIMDENIMITDGRVNRIWGTELDTKVDGVIVGSGYATESYGKYGSGGGAFGPMPFKYRGRIIDSSVNGKGQFYSSSTLLYVTGIEGVSNGGASASSFRGSAELTLYVDSLKDSKALAKVGRTYNDYGSSWAIVDSRGYPLQINYWITDADSIFPISDASYVASPGRDGQWGDATPDDAENSLDAGTNHIWPNYGNVNPDSGNFIEKLFVTKQIDHYYDDHSEEAAKDNPYSRAELKKN